jgi:hypothetical protein
MKRWKLNLLYCDFQLVCPLSSRRTISIVNSRTNIRRPEIRNSIYELVLGRNELHVYAQDNSKTGHSATAWFYPCHVHFQDDSSATNKDNHQREWLDQHLPCLTRICPALPNRQFLLTCKRIYQEANLIPYSSNTFIFVTPLSLNIFVSKVLTQAQSRALRSIGIWTAISTHDVSDPQTSWKYWRPSSQIVEQGLLSSVQNLQISISVFASSLDQDDPQAWRDMKQISGLLEFAKNGLRGVGVAVSHTVDSDGGLARKELIQYAEDVRATFLEGNKL